MEFLIKKGGKLHRHTCPCSENMDEDISDIRNEETDYPALPIKDINTISASYNGDGNLKVDKKCSTYYKDNQELIVESAFIGNISLHDILKTYLLERRQSQMEVASSKSECYNTTNMIAAAPKEVC